MTQEKEKEKEEEEEEFLLAFLIYSTILLYIPI